MHAAASCCTSTSDKKTVIYLGKMIEIDVLCIII
jgi:hypothetical protein